MAFKQYSLVCLISLLILLPPTSQLILPDDFDDCFALYAASKTVTAIAFSRLAKSLRTVPHHIIITSLLERNLRSVNPSCEEGFLFFVDRENKLTIFDTDDNKSSAVTLFVPPDEAVRFGEGISIGNQVAMARVDKAGFESGELSKGSEFAVWDRYTQSKLVVSEVVRGGDDGGLMVSINGVNVTEWDIYNDGHVIVHRTDDFFTFDGENIPDRINTDAFEVV